MGGESQWCQQEIAFDRVKWTRETLFQRIAVQYIPNRGERLNSTAETDVR